jgi:hypothetical protein
MLVPDPTANVVSTARQPGNCALNPGAQNKHVVTVPAAGVLKLTIDAQDPKPGTPYLFDWDIFLLDGAGANLADGNSTEAHEEIAQKFKKASRSRSLPATSTACRTPRWRTPAPTPEHLRLSVRTRLGSQHDP